MGERGRGGAVWAEFNALSQQLLRQGRACPGGNQVIHQGSDNNSRRPLRLVSECRCLKLWCGHLVHQARPQERLGGPEQRDARR